MSTVETVDPMAGIRTRVGEIVEQAGWPRERLQAMQAERLRRLLQHAVERSPYYRDALGEDAPSRRLGSLPTLPKSLLMDEFERVVTDARLRRVELERFVAESQAGELHDGYRVFSTSGSGGGPGLFVYSPDEFAEWIAVGLARLARSA